MKRDTKVYIFLIVFIFIFLIVMFLLFGVENIRQEKYSTTVIVGDTSVWKYEKRKWINIRTRASLDQLSWQKYHVFTNNKELGEYYLWYNEKRWYAFDEKKNAIPVDTSLFAYHANYDMKVYDFKTTEVDATDEYVQKALQDHNLGLTSTFTSNYKTKIDIDHDSVEEEFYILSNAFPMGADPERIFSLAFMVKNDEITYIYEDVFTKTNAYNGCKPYYNVFLDTNNDNKYEIILSCGRYSATDQIDMLYQYDKKQFKIIISNQ